MKKVKLIVARIKGAAPSFNQRIMIQFFEKQGYEIVYKDLDAREVIGCSPSYLIIDEIQGAHNEG